MATTKDPIKTRKNGTFYFRAYLGVDPKTGRRSRSRLVASRHVVMHAKPTRKWSVAV
ncbi:hypothetical protein PPA04_10340 [Pediococcus parvulus]|nr:hypothetical protein PPA04_10340 [Pediococcus parvulus]GHC04300.1 hypothetical protein GCM10008912_04540 [Pediococcus parvulus]